MAAAFSAWGQDAGKPPSEPAARVLGKSPAQHPGAAESLYLQLRSVGLDSSRVYSVRDLSIQRGGFHLALDDGTIAFTQDVAGKVTGAFFIGEGEILLSPPDQAERASMLLFTGSTILEEKFSSAYFRFNDDTYTEVQSALRPAENPQEFVTEWDQTARSLAETDALRLLLSFSRHLPAQSTTPSSYPPEKTDGEGRILHVRLQGRKLGAFDVYYDANAGEQIWAGQSRNVGGANYYDVWTSFSNARRSTTTAVLSETTAEGGNIDEVDVSHFTIRAEIRPPTELKAEATLEIGIRQGGGRALLFELSRFLQVENLEMDGKPVEFIHNQAVEGTQLARHGNDLVVVIFPELLRAGQKLTLRFVYSGAVLSEAGSGLLYVGARGNWYPNRGLQMSNYDLQFTYPADWTLVATGKRVENSAVNSKTTSAAGSDAVSHWVSERPIPVAGFNLGKYQRVTAQAGNITVETYATAGVEKGFPQGKTETVMPSPTGSMGSEEVPIVVPALPPSPARHAQAVANTAARAIDAFSQWFGPYPYSGLALTQLPGLESQGWPGLIFLSSFSFLTSEEKSELHMSDVNKTVIAQVVAHETAHQWWGDLVGWSTYRDQWLSEALANYSSLMLLESEEPAKFRAVLAKYREDLLQKNQNGVALSDDGPVTLGTRLSNSQFPEGYEAVSYGRGTWLFHMLRCMLRDAGPREPGGTSVSRRSDEPFLRVLRRLREQYQGKAITTRDLMQVFEEQLPASLAFEGHRSLDWFYEGWISGISIPRIELRGVKYLDKATGGTVSGTIVQKDAPDTLVTSVPLYASHAGKLEYLGRVFADGPETSFHLKVPAGTRKVVVDPYETILAKVR
jgi:hypothetical protein